MASNLPLPASRCSPVYPKSRSPHQRLRIRHQKSTQQLIVEPLQTIRTALSRITLPDLPQSFHLSLNGKDAISDDLTFAEVECRRMVMDEVDRLRAQVPGFEDAHLTDVALTLGVTESRRLDGAYTLARDDANRVFDDTIASTGHWTKYGAVYHIPYRSLLPRSVSNLLVAGRCSVDHRVHHATKEIPPAFATGEAAGIAAVQALRASASVQGVDVGALRAALRAAGAWLP